MSDYRRHMNLLKIQGRMHEQAARISLGTDAVILDDQQVPGLKGGRFPTYDISSSTEIASVKSHIGQDTEPTREAISAYRADFGKMLGWSREPGAVRHDAENLMKLRAAGMPIPSKLKNAQVNEISEYLKTESVLRIPDDHLDAVRQSLESDIRNLPGNYFLPEQPSEDQVAAIVNRIQGTGLSSSETVKRMQNSREFQELVSQDPLHTRVEADRSNEESSVDEKYSHGYGH